MDDGQIDAESTKLDEIIAEYIFAEEAGESVSREELLEQHPDLSDELKEFFADRDRFKRLASPLSPEASRHNDLPATVRYFGDYELLEEVAQGGMGVVYKARQTSLNRIVAVKMILAGHLASDDDVKRFTDEAETAASLRHKAIVPIHEVGQQEGQHYFSMDYIEGKNLAELIRTDPPSPSEAARIVKAVAEAVDYAHQEGIVHRDIKPSNILIDETGQVHVTDFGLAMRVEGDHELTRTGQVLGTPSY
ncbi:MAG: serine/threonine-protein kinase, partial [Planctomycetota bacterium]